MNVVRERSPRVSEDTVDSEEDDANLDEDLYGCGQRRTREGEPVVDEDPDLTVVVQAGDPNGVIATIDACLGARYPAPPLPALAVAAGAPPAPVPCKRGQGVTAAGDTWARYYFANSSRLRNALYEMRGGLNVTLGRPATLAGFNAVAGVAPDFVSVTVTKNGRDRPSSLICG
jgi:hypothetical protein